MVSKTFNRYIWLLDLLLRKQKLSFVEICVVWQNSSLGDGKELSLRTFHQHRKAVEELFGVEIKCDPSDGYRYYISNPERLKGDRTRKWLLNSFALSNLITAGHNMNGRILYENTAGGSQYIPTIIEAMQENRELLLDYQKFGESRRTLHLQPYAMKVYNKRWYVLGWLAEDGGLRQLALERILELETTDRHFELPEGFSVEKYYADSVGIYVDDKLKPQRVRIRAYRQLVDNLRSLPLHKSQQEVLTRHQQFSEFQYRVCLTPELTTQLLSMGEQVEVLEPQELRAEMKERMEKCLMRYKA